MMRIVSAAAAALLFLSTSSNAAFQEGDSCGVQSADFVLPEFLGDYAVAGQGCTLEGDGNDGCFCAPDLNDNERLSGWKWQCTDSMFGPKNGKVCPDRVPVPKQYGVDSEEFSIALQQVGSPCNTTVNPTGHLGDEVCGYSECEDGGEYSAVCACVDMEDRVPGAGSQWFCLHATCACTEEEAALAAASAATAAASSMLATAVAAVLMAVMVHN